MRGIFFRGRLHAGREQSFIQAWSRVSELLRERGSLGSRLHRGPEDIWYSYAQWPSEAARAQAFSLPSADPQAMEAVRAAIAESLPDIVLESVADFMVLPTQSRA